MTVANFIPSVWSDQTIDRWVAEVVFPTLVSRKYEGIAAKGNVVKLTGVVAPDITDYKAAGRVTSAQNIGDTGVDLLINQEKSFDFKIDDIDATQAAGSFGDWTNAAGDALATDSDAFIGGLLITNGTALAGSPATPTSGDAAWNLLVSARKQLQKAKVPAANRVVGINAEFEALLLQANSKLTAFDTSGDNNGLREATIGKILGMRIVSAANLPVVNYPQFVAFHQNAAAYVSQLDKVEALRANDSFADRYRGLHVYGGKVIKPTGVVYYTGS
ncbi:P22 phage major capsid protein family protein [Subtercola sp. RTI3]|uniref:P22 phage major capsid protein family protein n=1 Tax=Subtercola sp. RTI3 TaxID=3048639 RepID=UPI002B236436|nr:P22 phage major capsid protein family protein [Subtercola sp. RTI3]MEA9983654.1 P22 phage major capsid protein family protein [Subtercola sp. RTI3]